MPDLESLLHRLIQGGFEFVVVGGVAAVAHGVSLPTQDVDVCCRFTPENLLRLQGAIADLHPVHRMVPARPPLRLTVETCAGLRNLYLDTDWGQLDCLGEILGVGGYQDVAAHSVPVELAGGICRILSIDALIRAKEAGDSRAASQLIFLPPRDAAATRRVEDLRQQQPRLGRELRRGRVQRQQPVVPAP